MRRFRGLVFGIAVQLFCRGVTAVPMRMGDDSMPPKFYDDTEATPSATLDIVDTNVQSTESSSTEINQGLDWSAWWSQFFTNSMAYQCTGTGAVQLRPAIGFFACTETEPSGSLFRFFASTGLNVTEWRLKLIARTQAQTVKGLDTLSAKENSDVAAVSAFVGAYGLVALTRRVAARADDLCLNTDAFMDCMDPYLQACFPNQPVDFAVPTERSTISSSENSSALDDQWLSDLAALIDMFNINATQNGAETPVFNSTEASVASSTEVATPEPGSKTSDEVPDQTSSPNTTDIDVGEIDIVIMLVPDGNSTEVVTTEDSLTGSTESSFYNDNKEKKKGGKDEVAYGFFGLPYLTSADKISGFLRRELQIMCESNFDASSEMSHPFADVLSGVPCLLSQKIPSPCPPANFQDDDLILNKGYTKCILDNVRQECSVNGADTMQAMVDEYVEDVTPSDYQTSTQPRADAVTNSSSISEEEVDHK